MKIAFLSRYQNTVNRGAESFVKELTERLSKKHTVDILSGSDSDSLKKVLSGKYDIVWSINGRVQSLKAAIGRIIGHYKLVICGLSGVGRDEIWNVLICRPDIYIPVTNYMYNWVKPWGLGVKLVKIPIGIDLSKFSSSGVKIFFELKHPIVLSVGALYWYKHHELTINAISKLQDVSLVLVGNGPEKVTLEKLGKEKLGDRFKIIQASYGTLPEIYRSADLFVLPSWDREAFGIVYLEALASGLGVVAPNDLSRQEIIGEAGILVDTEDLPAYVNAIENALNIDWKKKSRKQAEKFSWDKIAKRYEEVMRDLIQR